MKPLCLIFIIIFVSLPIYNFADEHQSPDCEHEHQSPPKTPHQSPDCEHEHQSSNQSPHQSRKHKSHKHQSPHQSPGPADEPQSPHLADKPQSPQQSPDLSKVDLSPGSIFSALEKIPIPKDIDVNLLKNNDTLFKISKELCVNCPFESLQFMFLQNVVRAKKGLQPLMWDLLLERYAKWWAVQRKSDCKLEHSMKHNDFQIGECIYWHTKIGESTPEVAVKWWADEEKFYDIKSNTCAKGEQCGHYTQMVWKTTRRVGCARVVCDNGDVFMTCNYYAPGNIVGEKPY